MEKSLMSLKDSKLLETSKNLENNFDEIWARLCAAFPRTSLTVATTAIYYERLGRFRSDDLKRATNIIIDNCEYFPTVAEIINTIRQLPKMSKPLLLEFPPPPSIEEIAATRSEIQKLINNFDYKFVPKNETEEQRRAKLREQAEKLKKEN